MRTLSIYIATSLDGYIAKPNDDLSFLKLVEQEGEDYGYAAFTATIDTVIIGRKTYDWVARSIGPEHYANGGRDVYVITRTPRPSIGRTFFHTDGPVALVEQLHRQPGQGIYCDGGAETIRALLQADLIDELIISVVPVLLGSGTRLFQDAGPELALELVDSRSYPSGLCQLHYRRKRG